MTGPRSEPGLQDAVVDAGEEQGVAQAGAGDLVVAGVREPAPLVVELAAIRLDRVEDPLARRGVLAFQLDGPPEEVQAIMVGSPPCQATTTSGDGTCPSISWRR